MAVIRLLQVSDIHGSMTAVEKIFAKAKQGFDAVLAVGDITNFGTIAQAETILSRISEAGVMVFFVAGNCDPEAMLDWRPNNSRTVNLHLRAEALGELGLMGVGGGIPPFGTLIEFNEEQLRNMLSSIRPLNERFILLSHTPPYGTDADYTRGRHVGSRAIREYAENYKPLAVCCGHIHEARSVSTIGRTKVINAGPARGNRCAIITVKGEGVDASLAEL